MRKLFTCLILGSVLLGGPIIYGIYGNRDSKEMTNEEKITPVDYPRFRFHKWYAGKGLIPSSFEREREAWQIGSKEDLLKACGNTICTVDTMYIPRGGTSLVYERNKNYEGPMFRLLGIDPRQLKMFDGVRYIYNPKTP